MNVSCKSSYSFGSRSIRMIGGGLRNNLFNLLSCKSVVIDLSRGDKLQLKFLVQVGLRFVLKDKLYFFVQKRIKGVNKFVFVYIKIKELIN